MIHHCTDRRGIITKVQCLRLLLLLIPSHDVGACRARVLCTGGRPKVARPTRETRQLRGAYHHGVRRAGRGRARWVSIGLRGAAHEMGRADEQVLLPPAGIVPERLSSTPHGHEYAVITNGAVSRYPSYGGMIPSITRRTFYLQRILQSVIERDTGQVSTAR